MRDLIADLSAAVGQANVLTEPDVLAGYATDWTRRYRGAATCVVWPASTDEMTAVILACADAGVPIVPQGETRGWSVARCQPPSHQLR